jgi:molecular chaperone GrpE
VGQGDDSGKVDLGQGVTGDPAPDDRVRVLETELTAAREEARQNHERWLRERADLENVKRRAERERADTVKFGNERLIKDLLPIVDNLERAVGHARGGGNGQPLVQGVELVLKALLDVLERHGVTRIQTGGARFDPAHHEAMAQVESAEHEPNAVVAEHQAGFRLNDRLLRPALVTVAKAPADPKLAKDQGRD